MSDVNTVEEVELDAAAVDAIVEKTKEAMAGANQEAIDAAVKKAVEEATVEVSKSVLDEYLKNTEEIEKKAVLKAQQEAVADDPLAKGLADGTLDKDIAAMSPAMRFFRQMKALTEEDSSTLRKINKVTLATQIKARKEAEAKGAEFANKAGYGNEATQADGSVLVPDADFITTVYDNLPNYGVALREADVRQTDRTSVRVISLDSGLTFYSTAEAGVKTAAKLAFSKNEVSLQKYAVIVPATDELTDDAAIDFWNLVTRELARAYAAVADQITFTDPTYGITNLSGVITQPVSGAGTTVLWDDLLKAEGKLEDDLDESNHKWYMRKETWYRLLQLKGTTNDAYLYGSLADGWIPNPKAPTTPWGREVVFVRVLPTSGASAGSPGVVGSNDAFAVFGDLKNYILFTRRGMQLKMLTEATIIDQASVSTNLATQDISAMRAVVRILGTCPKGNRSKFVLVGTGTVS
jgi:HK97 family phage major capsid protein